MSETKEWGPDSPNGDMVPILQRSLAERRFLRDLEPLSSAHRCDRCGAAAKWRLYRPPTTSRVRGLLEFCGHHFNIHKGRLDVDGWQITESIPA